MPDILHQLAIQVPPAAVYQALTEQKQLAAWWTRSATAEPHVGSVARFALGGRGPLDMIIKQLDPARTVKWRCIGGDPEWTGTELIFELKPEGEGTVVRFSHRGWKAADGALPACCYEWGRALASLKQLLETGTGSPL